MCRKIFKINGKKKKKKKKHDEIRKSHRPPAEYYLPHSLCHLTSAGGPTHKIDGSDTTPPAAADLQPPNLILSPNQTISIFHLSGAGRAPPKLSPRPTVLSQ